MKSLIALSQVLLEDLGKRCGVSTLRDVKTVTARVDHEGESFLTITLPAFAKDFERSLEQGRIDDDQFSGYARTGGLPRFLGGFLRLVFDAKHGTLMREPSIDAIRAIRQFTMAFGKINIECSKERVDAAIDGYMRCELDVIEADQRFPLLESVITSASNPLFRELFSEIDREVYDEELVPKHGPGSTAERLLGNEKYNQLEWTDRLDRFFPADKFLIPSIRYWSDLGGVTFHEPGDERPVRVVTVPKTLKAPRIIAIEPTCMQYAQQALMERIVEGIEGSDLLSPLIGFTDQNPNRELAREGSRFGKLATLDMSEASDRVSNLHVMALLKNHPNLAGAVQACRSMKADVPGYGVIPLAKFASMGSALCFPFEAMVFLSIILGSIASELSVPVTRRFITDLHGKVRVYGDDIIVPVEFAPAVISSLEGFGLKVNTGKSFWTGKFRESCGGDYYDGHWITPVRVRHSLPTSPKHVHEIVGTVALRNNLLKAGGFDSTIQHLDTLLSRLLPVYNEVPDDSSALGRHTYEPISGTRMCAELQRPLVKACVVKQILPLSPLEGTGALMKFFLKRGFDPLSEDSFIRAGRPSSARITTKWVPSVHWGNA